MKFYNRSRQLLTDSLLEAEYKASREIGTVRAGSRHVFFRSGIRNYAVPYTEIIRCYRRIMQVPMKMCCGSGNLDVEYLVLEDAAGEIAQIQLPGKKAALALMDELKEAAPALLFTPPSKAGAPGSGPSAGNEVPE